MKPITHDASAPSIHQLAVERTDQGPFAGPLVGDPPKELLPAELTALLPSSDNPLPELRSLGSASSQIAQLLSSMSSGSVWGPPLVKALAGAAMLIAVAYLGHLSQHLENYGPIRKLDAAAVSLVELAHSQPDSAQGKRGLGPTEQQAHAARQTELLAQVPQTSQGQAELKSSESESRKADCPESPKGPQAGILPDGRVILNEANVAELSTLPGIGEARATAILELRARLKGFKKVTDLLRIRGIGPKSLNKLKERSVVDRPAETAPIQREAEAEAEIGRVVRHEPLAVPSGSTPQLVASTASLHKP
jgi:competence protein ComEA